MIGVMCSLVDVIEIIWKDEASSLAGQFDGGQGDG
jgi:hypothetical protein